MQCCLNMYAKNTTYTYIIPIHRYAELQSLIRGYTSTFLSLLSSVSVSHDLLNTVSEAFYKIKIYFFGYKQVT